MRSLRLVVLAVAAALVPAASQASPSLGDGESVSSSERRRPAERPLSQRVAYYEELICIAEHESGGRWDIATGNGYYGGLQMDRQFQQTYAPRLYRRKGTADNWTREEQLRAAARAVRARGFSPWPTTARICGLPT
jgi:hypothetical protein